MLNLNVTYCVPAASINTTDSNQRQQNIIQELDMSNVYLDGLIDELNQAINNSDPLSYESIESYLNKPGDTTIGSLLANAEKAAKDAAPRYQAIVAKLKGIFHTISEDMEALENATTVSSQLSIEKSILSEVVDYHSAIYEFEKD